MMRIISTVLFATVMATPALAGDKAEKEALKAQKAEVKYAKSASKDVAKLSKKFAKKSAKDNDTSEIEAELNAYYRDELSWLRAKGIPTIETPYEPQRDPAFPLRVLPEPESERPKMENLRDIVVDLKNGDLKDGKKSKKLNEFSTILSERFERKNARYKADKKG